MNTIIFELDQVCFVEILPEANLHSFNSSARHFKLGALGLRRDFEIMAQPMLTSKYFIQPNIMQKI